MALARALKPDPAAAEAAVAKEKEDTAAQAAADGAAMERAAAEAVGEVVAQKAASGNAKDAVRGPSRGMAQPPKQRETGAGAATFDVRFTVRALSGDAVASRFQLLSVCASACGRAGLV